MTATSIVLERYMWKRPGSAMWQLRKPVPTDVQRAFGRSVVTKSLGTANDRDATVAALAILDELERQWASIRAGVSAPPTHQQGKPVWDVEPPEHVKQSIIRAAYKQVMGQVEARANARFLADRAGFERTLAQRRASARDLRREVRTGDVAKFVEPTEKMLVNRGFDVDRDAPWFHRLVRDMATTVLDAQDVGMRADEGELDPQPRTEIVRRALGAHDAGKASKDLPLSELVEQFMKHWLAGRSGGKDTNTEPQKRSTFRLFCGYFDDRPIRAVRRQDAAEFFDKVRLLDPNWARSPASRRLTWSELIDRCGDRQQGLSDATMNRHLQVLQELWHWASKRGHCAGENPFEGFHKKLRAGVNVKPYVAWEDEELRHLLSPPPKRADLLEVILVGMFTGMRLDEIASLTWGQVRQDTEGGASIAYFQVEDAKTPAGNRKVPVHPELRWLLSRARGASGDRLWPTFNEEGRGMKPGNDAGREFSRFKTQKGFTSRTKTFHSFRKNVTRMMERAQVPENDWAQIFGHERGFTYRVYNPDGIDMARRAEIIGLIAYPGVAIQHPSC